jgi:anti-sigma regulatory factor (Ser/Thr protein kinase)
VCEFAADAVMFELSGTVQAPGEARGLVEHYVCRVHGKRALEAAQVVVSELTTAAVLYGEAPIVLDLSCEVNDVRVAVTHRAEGSLVRDIPIDEEGGLRSAMLAELSSSWGVERGLDARTLWSLVPTGVSRDLEHAVPASSGRGW